jgi:serine/threonine protein kinase
VRLSQGSTLGPYEIVAPIGAGGMGEVYRARDTRLGRDVAIKVLPKGRGTDADALARFEREGQAIAALSHPNILAIHDVGHHEDVVYTVSELLEGETLGQRLASGPLPVRKAIEYGTQVAQGLAAAHGRGVVHRDLKPENVFLTRDGQAKILDFGLAKMDAPHSSPGEADKTVTKMASHTMPGVVMGTPGYMSPEQVRGQAVDHRSDIFTLGAMLYEMLTGRRAFAEATPADTSSAILNKEPQEISELQPDVPPSVEVVIHHCLEKNPEERFQSARDLAFALQRLSSLSVTSAAAETAVQESPRRRSGLLAVLAVLIVGTALVAAYVIGEGSAGTEPPSFLRLTFQRGSIRSARVAADGQTIVYGAAWDGDPIRLFSTRPDSPASRQLDLPDADILAISSKGEMAISVGRTFLSPHQNTGTLARVALAGGAPRLILENVQEADWSPDGGELAVVHEVDGHNRLEYPIGKVLFETTGWIGSPRVSPDGQRIAILEHELRWDDGGWVTVIDLQGNRERLTQRWSSSGGLAWSRGGDEIWFTAGSGSSARALRVVDLSGNHRVVYEQTNQLTLFDLLPDGKALLGSTNRRREVRFGTAGEERNLSWLDWSLSTFLSQDGSMLLINEQGQASREDYSIYLRSSDGSTPVHIGIGIPMAISPDGSWAVSRVSGAENNLVLFPTGAGSPRELATVHDQTWAGWFPDGRSLLFSTGGGDETFRLYVHELDGETRQLPGESLLIEPFSDPIAPDGKHFFARGLSEPARIFSVDGGEPQPIAGLDPADSVVRWSTDGRWLYFYQRGMPAIYGRIEVATGNREVLGELAPPDRAGAVGIWPVLVSADGRSYAYSYPRFLTDLYLVDNLR